MAATLAEGVSLKTIPFESLVNIVSFYRSSLTPRFVTPRLCELSLVCRAFNDACSVFLFRNYHVESDDRFEWRRRHATGHADVKARISVIVRKARYIRELEIVVDDEVKELVQELISAMRHAAGIVSLTLSSNGPSQSLPEELMTAVRSRGISPKVLRFVGDWYPPEGAEIINEIEELHISPVTNENILLTTFIKAPDLYLENRNQVAAPFKPTQFDSHLRRISVVLSGLQCFRGHYLDDEYDSDSDFIFPDDIGSGDIEDVFDERGCFDFSQVPSVNVDVKIMLDSNQLATGGLDGCKGYIDKDICRRPQDVQRQG